jgi:nitric oxide dioxygenase
MGQKALIQASFRRALTVADLAIELFYGRLHLLDPPLWHLLGAGVPRKQQDLLCLLVQAVEDLDRLDRLASTLEAVARRCVSQGVREAHYDTIAGTLLWTLHQVLGDAYSPRIAEAWSAACALLIGRMKRAAAAQEIDPSTLRRIRRSSCPERWQGAFGAVSVLSPICEPVYEDAEIDVGRFAELPPSPTSRRIPAMPLSSRLTPIG